MTALSIKNHNLYEKIGHREISLPEFTTFFKQLTFSKKRRRDRWPYLLYKGTFGYQQLDRLEQEFQELGVWDPSDKEEGAFQKELSHYGTGFGDWKGDYDLVFSKIYQTLEGLKTFASR